VLGFTTDGEFNTLCTKGVNRPTSIIQIKKDLKEKVAAMKPKDLTAYLIPKRRAVDGTIHATRPHPAVTQEYLQTMYTLTWQGQNHHRALQIARRSFFPFHHDPVTWREGKDVMFD